MNRSEAVSRYVAKAAPYAQPILDTLRATVHKSCPKAEETLKWGFPHFMYQGKILCSMAAFKQHCAFGFWLGSQMKDPDGILENSDQRNAMGNLGRITQLKDLPSTTKLQKVIKEAMRLIDSGATLAKRQATPKPEAKIPTDLARALKSNLKASDTFKTFPPSHRREYIDWINEAKRDETRVSRIAKTIALLNEGKSRNWKYETRKKA